MISQLLRTWTTIAIAVALVACGRSGDEPSGSWAVTYQTDVSHTLTVNDVRSTVDDGAVIAGAFHFKTDPGETSDDGWLAKLDASGNIVWQHLYGGPHPDYARIVHPTADRGYIVAGNTMSDDQYAWLLKLDSNGNVQWQQMYGGLDKSFQVNGMQPTQDAGYVLVGTYENRAVSIGEVWVMKANAVGGIDWQWTYGGDMGEEGQAIALTPDGGFLVAASTHSFGAGSWDAWILKLDASGSIQWQRAYGGPESDSAAAIVATVDGGAVFTGRTSSPGPGSDLWAIKLDGQGNVEWETSIGATNSDAGRAIASTADGGYILAGYMNADAWVLKLDASGNLLWQWTYGGSGFAQFWPRTIEQTTKGGFVTAGHGVGVYAVKLNESGRIPGCGQTASEVTVRHTPTTVGTGPFGSAPGTAVPVASALRAMPAAVSEWPLCSDIR